MSVAKTEFSVRPVRAEELDAWLRFRNQGYPWPVDLDRFLFLESLRPSDEPVLRLGAWSSDGQLVGTAECEVGEEGERWDDRAAGYVLVAPEHRRQGLGARLAQEIERFATDVPVRWLEALFLEHDASAGVPFVSRRGFHELERYRLSIQQPASVNLGGLAELRAQLQRLGVDTVAFSAIDSDASRHALYRCTMAIEHDMPHEAHVGWQDPSFDAWQRKVFTSPGSSSDAIFVARDGEHIVGLTYLIRRAGGDAEVIDTGVLASYRRRGIARVLKMMATEWAAQQGIARVQTDNRTDNAGMLAINKEIGFVPGEAIEIFEKTL